MTVDRPRVTIYTDGGADPNPGPGGWAAILIHEATGRIKELSGGEPYTTNNRMELTAAIEALSALTRPCTVQVFTDSEYVRQGITEWIEKWIAGGWTRGRRKEPVENADLWQRLHTLTTQHEVAWQWVRGHGDDRFNIRVDHLATREIRRFYAAADAAQPADASVFLIVSARPHAGLWAALIRSEGKERILTGRLEDATANQLDLCAAIAALNTLPPDISVRVYSLSDYLRNGASRWLKSWKQRGWRTAKGEPVRNVELWKQLDAELSIRRVEWPPAKGDHALELTFEDLAYRVQDEMGLQEGHEEEHRDWRADHASDDDVE